MDFLTLHVLPVGLVQYCATVFCAVPAAACITLTPAPQISVERLNQAACLTD